jgi:hypothetical protein
MTAGRPDGRTACVLFLILLTVRPSGRVAAQDTTKTGTAHVVFPSDTLRKGVRPMGAFWRSFLIPGWGQAVTGRTATGAAFVAWEGVTAMMTLKAQQEANYFRSIHSANLELKKQEVQDWAVLWAFNHLFAGAEAYVSAHLRDFPPDLKVRAYPGGIGVTFPIHE